jgi:hypothetical protein
VHNITPLSFNIVSHALCIATITKIYAPFPDDGAGGWGAHILWVHGCGGCERVIGICQFGNCVSLEAYWRFPLAL